MPSLSTDVLSDLDIRDPEAQNQPEESLPSTQHRNFQLSAPLGKTDDRAGPVPQYPQAFSLCAAEANPDKASASPSNI